MAVVTIAENAQFGDVATHRIGPWTNALGHLYVIAVDKAALQVNAWKSNDQGYTWSAIEGPAGLSDQTDKMPGPRSVAVARAGDKLWCVFPIGAEVELVAAAFDVEADTWSATYAGGPAYEPESRPEGIGAGQLIGGSGYRFFVEALSDGSLVVLYTSTPHMYYYADGHQWYSIFRASVTTFAQDVTGKDDGWGSRVLVMPAEESQFWGATPVGSVVGEDDIVHMFFESFYHEPGVERIPVDDFASILLHGTWNSGAFVGPTELVNPFAPDSSLLLTDCFGMPGRREIDGGAKQIARVALPVHGADEFGIDAWHTDYSSSSFTEQQIATGSGRRQFGCFEMDDASMGILTTPTFTNPDPDGLRLEVWRATDGDFAREPDTILVPFDFTHAIARGANNAVAVIVSSPAEYLRFITAGGAPADIVGVNGIPSSVLFGQTSGVRGGEDARCEDPGTPSPPAEGCGDGGPITPPDRELHPRCAYAMAL